MRLELKLTKCLIVSVQLIIKENERRIPNYEKWERKTVENLVLYLNKKNRTADYKEANGVVSPRPDMLISFLSAIKRKKLLFFLPRHLNLS